MHKILIIFIILISSLFYGCHSSNAFNVEEEMMGGKKRIMGSPTNTYWVSLETTSKNAIKKSEDLIPIYYSLFYEPKNNEINITTIGGVITNEVNIKNAKLPTELGTLSEFKGINIYKLFFKNKRKPELEEFIEKNSNKIKKKSLSFKVTLDPEIMIYKEISKHIKKELYKQAIKKYIDKDFAINGKFLVVKIYDFKYQNLKKIIDIKFDYIFTELKAKKVDYGANLDSIEELILSNMNNGNFKDAQKFNDIYKGIAPDKVKYYNNAYTINMKLGNKMSALLILIEEIKVTDNADTHKDAITKLMKVFKGSLSRRNLRKVNRALSKSYKKFIKGKLEKDKFIDFLNNLVIEYSVE